MPPVRTYGRRQRRRRGSRLSPTRSCAPSCQEEEEDHVVETASAQTHADPPYAKEGHVPSSITATSSSSQQADAVDQDTEDLALKLKDVLHYQPICENHIWYYHLNFTAKTKEADGLDSTSENLFFVEVKRMGIGNYEEMLVSCFCMVNPDNGKPCKGCTNNGTVDMKHPDTDQYFAGHLDAYLPFGCFGKWSDSDDDDKYVKAREAKLRHMYEKTSIMVVVSGESVTIHYHSQLPCGSLKK
uniref:DUF3615 domain-containing protein n=1 Tax=Oryza glaberrima TaxID=4538 RepID=I1QJS7_ORYGL